MNANYIIGSCVNSDSYVKSVPKKWAQKIMNLLKFNYQEYEIHIPRENIRRFKERVDYFG